METEVSWVKQLRLSADGVPPPLAVHLDSAVVILGCCYYKNAPVELCLTPSSLGLFICFLLLITLSKSSLSPELQGL